MQKLATGQTRSPDSNFVLARSRRLMEFSDQGRENVRVLEIEVVAGTVEISGHERDGIETILLLVGLTHLDSGDFRDGVPLIGWFKCARQQVLLLDGLRSEFGIDAGAAKKLEFLHAVAIGSSNDVVLNG